MLGFLFSVLLVTSSAITLVQQGPLFNIYRPDDPASAATWYINDHTFVYGPGGEWHIFGITHTDPMNGDNEINLAHATVPQNFLTSTVNGTSQQWIKRPFAIGAKSPETHQWAPYVIQHPLSGHYFMFYCGGGQSREQYMINWAFSTDLYHWIRGGTAFTGGVDGRDPMVLPLNQGKDGFIIYYTAHINRFGPIKSGDQKVGFTNRLGVVRMVLPFYLAHPLWFPLFVGPTRLARAVFVK